MTIAKTDLVKSISAAVTSTPRKSVAADSIDPTIFPEHARVRAVTEIHEGDEIVPAGATGTIVHVIEGGIGYDVELTSPKHIVLSASRSELEPA